MSYGSQSMTAPLRRVLVRPPGEDFSRWREFGWRAEPDAKRIAAEHDAFCEALASEGAEIVVAESVADGNPDAIYVYDPALVADTGAILLRPGKKERRGEAKTMAADFAAAGVPITAALTEPAYAEGGDTMWLDETTLLVGLGYRTNEAAVGQLAAALPGVEVIAFDLPHYQGPGEVLHLLSVISPLDHDLARSPSTAIPRPARGSRRQASTCGSFRARSSRARATAARLASPDRSCGTERELDRLGRRRGPLDALALHLPAGLEHDDWTP